MSSKQVFSALKAGNPNCFVVVWSTHKAWNDVSVAKARFTADEVFFGGGFRVKLDGLQSVLTTLDSLPDYTYSQRATGFLDSQIRVYRHEGIKDLSFDFLTYSFLKFLEELLHSQ